MCGIAGVISFNTVKSESIRKEVAIRLFTDILQLTEERGKDAVGVASLYADGNFFGQKGNMTAGEHLANYGAEEDKFGGFLKLWREHKKKASIVIGHCRKSSVGNTSDNNNNHPIKVGNIVGIHNGTLKNHEIIFKKLSNGRDGDVDSEAIMRLFHKYTKNGKEPFTLDIMEEVVARIEGSYGVLVFNGNNPFQLATMSDQRPVKFALIKTLKLLVIASEKDFITKAINIYNKSANYFNKNLPIIKKEDVDFDDLEDRQVALFYLDRNVTEETTVSDLCETRKIPLARKEEDWFTKEIKAGYTTYGYTEPAKPENKTATYLPFSSKVIEPVHKTTPPTKVSVIKETQGITYSGSKIRVWDDKDTSYSEKDKVEVDFLGTIIVSATMKTKEITHVNGTDKALFSEGFSLEKIGDALATLKEIKLSEIDPIDQIQQNTVVLPSQAKESKPMFGSSEDLAEYMGVDRGVIRRSNGIEIANMMLKKAYSTQDDKAKEKEKQKVETAASIIGSLKKFVKNLLFATEKTISTESSIEVLKSIKLTPKDSEIIVGVFREGDMVDCPLLKKITFIENEGTKTDEHKEEGDSATIH